MINNPLFVSASEARGLVDITVVECNRLPLDTLVLKNAPENDGHAEFLFSIQDVYLGNSVLLDALKFSGQQGFAQSMQGDIRDSRVDVRRGKTQQNVVFNVGEKDRPLRIAGTTVLETKAISIDITIPPPLLRQMGQFGREILKVYPDGWPVPVSGTVTSPRPDFQRALAKVQQDLVPGLLEGLLNRGARGKEGSSEPAPAADRGGSPRKGKDTGNTAPAQPDPVKDLFDAIGRRNVAASGSASRRMLPDKRTSSAETGQLARANVVRYLSAPCFGAGRGAVGPSDNHRPLSVSYQFIPRSLSCRRESAHPAITSAAASTYSPASR